MSLTAPPPDSLPTALDRYLDHLRVERALMPATLESYSRDLREYLEWLESQGILQISQVGRLHVLAHLSALHARGLSRASQARHLAAVRGLHRFAAAEGVAPADPSDGVEASRGSRPLPRFLVVDEVDRLLAQPVIASARRIAEDVSQSSLPYAWSRRLGDKHVPGGVSDGETNWMEGVLLLAVYAILGVAFYHLPGHPPP